MTVRSDLWEVRDQPDALTLAELKPLSHALSLAPDPSSHARAGSVIRRLHPSRSDLSKLKPHTFVRFVQFVAGVFPTRIDLTGFKNLSGLVCDGSARWSNCALGA